MYMYISLQSQALRHGLLRVCQLLVPSEHMAKVRDIVDSHLFLADSSEREEAGAEEMSVRRAVEDEMKERHLQIVPTVVEQVSSLYLHMYLTHLNIHCMYMYMHTTFVYRCISLFVYIMLNPQIVQLHLSVH